MARVVDFELFRPVLEKALAYGDGAKGGRPPPLRSGGDVQDPDPGGAEHGERCADGIPDPRPGELAAVLGERHRVPELPEVGHLTPWQAH